MKILRLLFLLTLLPLGVSAQNVRYSTSFPSVSSTTATPYLVANIPPNSPILAVCNSPANALPCTNYATTYTSAGAACPNGAQDTPDPQPSACQSTGDAQGNIGFWAPAGKYDYTVCIEGTTTCYGPYTVTLGGSGGGFIAGGDLSGTGTSQTVVGILGHVLPSLTLGYLNWNGSAWLLSSAGSGVNITVNGGSALPSPVNFQTSSSAGQIDFSNPSGSNVQALLHNPSTSVNGVTCTLGSSCSIPGSGTVTSVATTGPIGGGTFTTSGIITFAASLLNAAYGGNGGGSVDNSAAFTADCAANPSQIYLPTGAFALTSSYAVTCPVVLGAGASFVVPTGVTLTLNYCPVAPAVKIFTLSGTGAVTFTACDHPYAEWFGAAGDGSTDDTTALQACVNSMPNAAPSGGACILQSRRYKFTANISIPTYSGIRGTTYIPLATTGAYIGGSELDFAPGSSSASAITFPSGAVSGSLEKLTIRRTVQAAAGSAGIIFNANYWAKVSEVQIVDFPFGILNENTPADNRIDYTQCTTTTLSNAAVTQYCFEIESPGNSTVVHYLTNTAVGGYSGTLELVHAPSTVTGMNDYFFYDIGGNANLYCVNLDATSASGSLATSDLHFFNTVCDNYSASGNAFLFNNFANSTGTSIEVTGGYANPTSGAPAPVSITCSLGGSCSQAIEVQGLMTRLSTGATETAANRLIPGIFLYTPACSAIYEGWYADITDSTTATLGATITGSGSNHVLGWCNGTNWVVVGGATPAGGGTVTTTGSPASGNLAKFSGATAITNGDLSGDVTTSGTLAATVVKVNGAAVPASKTIVGTNSSSQIVDASAATLANNTSGTAANLSGTPALPNGTTATTQSTSDNTTKLATDAFVQSLIGVVNPMTTLGDIIFENSTPTPARLAGNTSATKNLLCQTGTGSVSAAPVWCTLASGDIPANAANTSGTAANLSGTPALPNGTTATTQAVDDSSTKLATTAYVDRMKTRSVSFSYGIPGGTAFTTTPTLGYLTIPFACTIGGYSIQADAENGTITFKTWKVAAGTAIPTSGNSISTSGVSLTTGTVVQSTTVTDFTTTTVTANDIVAVAITSNASTNTGYVNFQLVCAQ